MHMIPATSTIEKTLKSIRAGQVVKLSGYLVEIKAQVAGIGAARLATPILAVARAS